MEGRTEDEREERDGIKEKRKEGTKRNLLHRFCVEWIDFPA